LIHNSSRKTQQFTDRKIVFVLQDARPLAAFIRRNLKPTQNAACSFTIRSTLSFPDLLFCFDNIDNKPLSSKDPQLSSRANFFQLQDFP